MATLRALTSMALLGVAAIADDLAKRCDRLTARLVRWDHRLTELAIAVDVPPEQRPLPGLRAVRGG